MARNSSEGSFLEVINSKSDRTHHTQPSRFKGSFDDFAQTKQRIIEGELTRADEWMNADQAYKYAGFRTRKALYQAVRRGIIPAHRLGKRSLRFLKSEIDRALAC